MERKPYTPYVTHIGGGRSRAIEPLPPFPKILIAIPACRVFEYSKWESEASPHYSPKTNHRNEPYGLDIHISGGTNPRIQAVRDTWWNDIGAHPTVSGRLFYGVPHPPTQRPASDEVFLSDVGDTYADLPAKSLAICRYMVEQGFDFVIKADDDTYIWVDRLVEEIIDTRPDYGGREHAGVCTGGPGWIMSRRSCKAVVANFNPANSWAEDVAVASSLNAANIMPLMLPGHRSGYANHWVDISKVEPDWVTCHAVRPEDMRTLYAREAKHRRPR